MIADDLERHRTGCPDCQRGRDCGIAAAMIQRHVAELFPAPLAVEVIDVDAHRSRCLDCTPGRLCDEGRALAAERHRAINDAKRRAGGMGLA